jgi:putative mRNA 3-end processing factor
MRDLLTLRPEGLWCEAGGFFVDPWRPVGTALVTHAHADHARPGNRRVIAAEPCVPLLRTRLGAQQLLEGVAYGVRFMLGDVAVSFHPAGHVLGSAQIRVDDGHAVWVVSGDYKRAHDPTCAPLEVVPCDVFVTESTFGLPVYRWRTGAEVAAEVLAWWDACRAQGRNAVLFAYALGKAQRLLTELSGLTERPVRVHSAIASLSEVYVASGVRMPPALPLFDAPDGRIPPDEGALALVPPSVHGSPMMRRFGEDARTGFASGWMQVRGARRRRGVDRGFVLSDHADWDALVRTCRETGARRVLVTHGNASVLARHLCDLGLDAAPLAADWDGEGDA